MFGSVCKVRTQAADQQGVDMKVELLIRESRLATACFSLSLSSIGGGFHTTSVHATAKRKERQKNVAVALTLHRVTPSGSCRKNRKKRKVLHETAQHPYDSKTTRKKRLRIAVTENCVSGSFLVTVDCQWKVERNYRPRLQGIEDKLCHLDASFFSFLLIHS